MVGQATGPEEETGDGRECGHFAAPCPRMADQTAVREGEGEEGPRVARNATTGAEEEAGREVEGEGEHGH